MIKTISTDSTYKRIIRVLHIDDDAFFLSNAKKFLEANMEFHVENAFSALDAIRKLKQANMMSSSRIIKCRKKTA